MKCCPAEIMPLGGRASTQSTAEVRTLRVLSGVELGRTWTAYHSLNCSEHRYKQWAEIDFLLLGPDCALVLEVKGGRIQRDNGVWFYVDRWGIRHRNTEGPFNQAKTAMYALKDLLQKKLGQDGPIVQKLAFGWGVVFPDSEWSEDSVETPIELVADGRQVSSSGKMAAHLRQIIRFWKQKTPHASALTPEETAKLHAVIRPDVDLYPPVSMRIGQVLSEMQALTDEQYERLDAIEANTQVVVSGGAGTGKTYLMIQCARREAQRGQSVLIVVESPELAAWLEGQVHAPLIKVMNYRGVGGHSVSCDVLMVDEGQDLLSLEYFSRLSELTKGGLENGRWRWFMDSSRQAGIAGKSEALALELLHAGFGAGPPVRLPLRQNIRNTWEVVRSVHEWIGVDIGETRVTGHGRKPKLIVFHTDDELLMKLEEALSALIAEGLEYGEFGIVTPLAMRDDLLRRLHSRFRRRLMRLDATTVRAGLPGKIVWGTAAQFKGLERPVVLAVGFDSMEYLGSRRAELYVAITRANYGVLLFAGPSLAMDLLSNEQGCQ